MKRVISKGYVLASIIEDTYEDTTYKALEVLVDNEDTYERVKLKSPSSYKLLAQTFAQQAKNNKQ